MTTVRITKRAVAERAPLTVVVGSRPVGLLASPDATVGELAAVLGLPATSTLWIDGRAHRAEEPLGSSGLVHGCTIAADGHDDAAANPADGLAAVSLRCIAGPSSGVVHALTPGRHLLGRAGGATVAIDDPELEPFAALIEVDGDGVRFTQLAGRSPGSIDGEHVSAPSPLEQQVVLELGSSQFILAAAARQPGAASRQTSVSRPWHRVVRRSPRTLSSWTPTTLCRPSEPRTDRASSEPHLGWITTVFALAGGVAVALVMRSILFLVLGGFAAFGSAAVWTVRSIVRRRSRRADRRRFLDEMEAFERAVAQERGRFVAHLRASTPRPDEIVEAAGDADVWHRRAAHPDAWSVSIGWGWLEWAATLEGEPGAPPSGIDCADVIDGVLVTADIGPGARIAIAGDGAPLVRSLITQLAVTTGPADWQLVVVADDPSEWAWCEWLPHALDGAAGAVLDADDADAVGATFDTLDDGDERLVLVVTDRPDLLATRTGAIRRFLAGDRWSALCTLVGAREDVPAQCSTIVDVRARGRARWTAVAAVAPPRRTIHLVGMSRATALDVARRLAGLLDPEVRGFELVPRQVGLSELLAPPADGVIGRRLTSRSVEAIWTSSDTPRHLSTPLGVGDGVVTVDLVADGPHALVGGTTGSGKSELLRTLVAGLAVHYSPGRLQFVLVDYKGGSTFDTCALLPHTVGVVTDLDEQLGERVLRSLRAELRWREEQLRERAIADLVDDDALSEERAVIPRLVVVIDEFAALAAELPEFLHSLVGIAQRGRSLGVHLVLATQRPAGVVSEEIRANTNLRLALRLHDVADARDVVGDDRPASFGRNSPGRAMVRLGAEERIEFQVASCLSPASLPDRRRVVLAGDGSGDRSGAGEARELDVIVRAVCEAADTLPPGPAHRPWLEPLPALLPPDGFDGSTVPAGAIGLLDAPDAQTREPLAWSPVDGNLVLYGSRGVGTTATLVTVARELVRSRRPDQLHLYAIDTVGDDRLDDLADLAHCGAAVRVGERERLGRLVDRLTGELERRCAQLRRTDDPEIVVLIDGAEALREVDEPFLADAVGERLSRVLTEGPAVGIVGVVVAHPGRGIGAFVAACPIRWMFHLDDAADALVVGARAVDVPPPVPGRTFDVGRRLVGQVVMPSTAAVGAGAAAGDAGGPDPVEVLPAVVDLDELEASHSERHPGAGDVGAATPLLVGLRFCDLAPASLCVRDGEHVLVAGSARSGRSTALRTICAAWRRLHASGVVVELDRDHTELPADLDPRRRHLVVVDDAERVADPDGTLAELIERGVPASTVVAAVRPGVVRSDYSHWTRLVRRSRLGVVLAAGGECDGEMLGEVLPRRLPVAARPGLAYLVQDGRTDLVQIVRTPPPS